MADVVLIRSCSNIYKLLTSIDSNALGNRKWDMVASPVQLVKQVSACSYTLIQHELDRETLLALGLIKISMEIVKYQKALSKIKELRMYCLLTVKFSNTCTAV